MEIFVSELPKSCNECFCSIEDTWCGASNGDVGDICYEIDNKIRSNHCPLKLLKDALAEERKKVCDDIRHNAISHNNLEVDMYYISPEQLDQIERGE